jgi:hypothetical protein
LSLAEETVGKMCAKSWSHWIRQQVLPKQESHRRFLIAGGRFDRAPGRVSRPVQAYAWIWGEENVLRN